MNGRVGVGIAFSVIPEIFFGNLKNYKLPKSLGCHVSAAKGRNTFGRLSAGF